MPVGRGSISRQVATEEFMARVADRVFNFSAGPAVLPLPVLEKAQDELLSLPGVGASVLEISHRSKAFDGILEKLCQISKVFWALEEIMRLYCYKEVRVFSFPWCR